MKAPRTLAYRAAVSEGCLKSERARRARERAERAVQQLAAVGADDLLRPELRDASIERLLGQLSRTDSLLASARPRSIVCHLRRHVEIIDNVLGGAP
jgi:hypothetical protein